MRHLSCHRTAVGHYCGSFPGPPWARQVCICIPPELGTSTSVLVWQSMGTFEVASVCLFEIHRLWRDLCTQIVSSTVYLRAWVHRLHRLWCDLCTQIVFPSVYLECAPRGWWWLGGNFRVSLGWSRGGRSTQAKYTVRVSNCAFVLRATRWSRHWVGVSADLLAGPGGAMVWEGRRHGGLG